MTSQPLISARRRTIRQRHGLWRGYLHRSAERVQCRPAYIAPAVPAPPAFKESSPAAYSAAPPGTWQPAQPQDAALKGKWWEMFNEPELNALEDQLNINNQNIAQYFQNFMAARAQVSEARAGFFPTATVDPATSEEPDGGVSSTGVSTASRGGAFNDFALPFDVSWEPDLWGRVRNTVREYQYAAQVSAADLENERLTEQADLAEYYFELRGQDALQDLYNRTVEADEQSLELTRALLETGIDNQEAVAQAEVTLKNAEAAGIGIATNRALYEHAIATLIGKPASTLFDAGEIADYSGSRPSRWASHRSCSNAGRISPRRNAPWRRPMRSSAWRRRPTTRR